MTDVAGFIILGIVAIALHWPTWSWLAAFGLAVAIAMVEIASSS